MYALFSKVNHNTLKNIQCFHIKGDLLLIYPEKAWPLIFKAKAQTQD